MKVVYLDTNLYVALIKPNDDNYSAIQKIISQSHLSFVTSTITLVELSSVLSREYDKLKLHHMTKDLIMDKDDSNLSGEIILLLLEYLISKTKTIIIPDPQIEILNYFHHKFMVNPIYKIAILESTKIRLRTLDLIHYANSIHYNTIQRIRIDYILSGDHSFISGGRSYVGIKDFTFITPEAMVELECN